MKILQLTIMFIFLNMGNMDAQIDKQWYVLEGMGWDSSAYSNPMTSNFRISGVIPDGHLNNPVKSVDIFAIYGDGLFTCTRDNSSFNYSNGGFDFKTPGSSPEYLYYTNKYSSDDPPQSVSSGSVVNGTNLLYEFRYGYEFYSRLAANQDVVAGSDIVVFLQTEALRGNGNCRLKFDIIETNPNRSIVNHNYPFIEPSQIFDNQNSATLPIGLVKRGRSYILNHNQFTNQENVFFNFRANQNISQFASQENDTPTHKAVFILEDESGNIIEELKEDIRSAHDPNYLTATHLCSNNEEQNFIKFKCGFENRSFTPANDLAIEISLPEGLNIESIDITTLKINGNHSFIEHFKEKIKTTIKSNKITIEFENRISIVFANGNANNHQIELEFCAFTTQDLIKLSKSDHIKNINGESHFFNESDSKRIITKLRYNDEIETRNSGQTEIGSQYRLRSQCDECVKSRKRNYFIYLLLIPIVLIIIPLLFKMLKIKNKSEPIR